ncbi:MAG: hypothetical protein QG673_758 [Pseudomonadota bacterium]|nr:hypothetical protein [Pseudomonadota bacterium]
MKLEQQKPYKIFVTCNLSGKFMRITHKLHFKLN